MTAFGRSGVRRFQGSGVLATKKCEGEAESAEFKNRDWRVIVATLAFW
jgi:hypothetical protein